MGRRTLTDNSIAALKQKRHVMPCLIPSSPVTMCV
jgi:hypothetical protein